MPEFSILYDELIEHHIARHDVTMDEFQQVVNNPSFIISQDNDRMRAEGFTASGRYLACVYEVIDDFQILAVTAFEV